MLHSERRAVSSVEHIVSILQPTLNQKPQVCAGYIGLIADCPNEFSRLSQSVHQLGFVN